MEAYLGIDVGSVTTKFAVLDDNDELVTDLYLLTQGKPIDAVQQGLEQIKQQLPRAVDIRGVAATGSARYLAGVIIGADFVESSGGRVVRMSLVQDASTSSLIERIVKHYC